ncbi:MAG: hypothetical protein LBC73_07395 [Oscillospiraceae bacterium]|jgi:hypothetical protein|nr:hypothetical protein [Oscillospiraceae bacterium]
MMLDVLGFLVGILTGVLQYFLLSIFTGAVSGGKFGKKTVLFAIAQFMLPFVVLLISAFILDGNLLLVAIGAIIALITCAVTRFIITIIKQVK